MIKNPHVTARAVDLDAVVAAPPPQTGWAAVKATWSQPSRWLGVLAAIAPSAAFVFASATWTLTIAIVAAAVTAVLISGLQLLRHERLRSALVGIVIVAACAAIAAITGEARTFFLLPTLLPFAVIMLCLASMVARRPLTGLILNRVTGGPADWTRHRRLLRVHLIATGTAVAINAVNGALQVIFYSRGDTAILAVAHAATGPIFATLVAVTVVAARKAITATTAR